MQQLKDVKDRGAKVIKVDFFDEDGNAVAPVSAKWTLTDGLGELINDREDVTINSPAASVYITLSGADHIGRTNRKENLRCLIVQAVYVSSRTGGQLPNNQAIQYAVVDLPQV